MDRVEYWNHGEVLKQILPDEKVGHVGIHVPQKHLLGLLLKKVIRFLLIPYLLNTKVIGLVEEEDQYVGLQR